MTQDTCMATLLQRASPLHASTLSPQVLLRAATVPSPSITPPAALATFTCQQQFLQEIHDAEETYSQPSPFEPVQDNESYGTRAVHGAVDLDRLLAELLELREALGDNSHGFSTNERRYLSLLRHDIVFSLAGEVIATAGEPQGSGNVKETCRSLLTLCVKPTSLSREIAFSLMHSVIVDVTVLAARNASHQVPVRELQDGLFTCVTNMVVKSVAVASSSLAAADRNSSSDGEWIRNAAACLLILIRSSEGDYRADRLVRLDASSILYLVRRAFSLTTTNVNEAELQEVFVEMLVCAMDAHHSRTTGCSVADGLSLSEVERFGGVDVLLAVFYRTASDRTRRLVLVVAFDLVMNQLTRSKPRDDDKDSWVSYEGLLRCLHDCEFATLVAMTPLSFITPTPSATARYVKTLHAAVENELLEKHVAVVWSALRSLLQVDEYFAHSAALAHALKLLSSQLQTQAHDSMAELIAAKVHQLLLSPRLEDRFKGERWLAELLVYGLPGDEGTSSDDNNAAYGSVLDQQCVLAEGTGNMPVGEDHLEESLCYDEAADIRLVARAALWDLSRSASVASRMAFARVLSLFTKRRVWSGAPSTVVMAHIRDLNHCLDALVAQQEDCVAVIGTMLETLLQIVAGTSSEVPYLDVHCQRYDSQSSDTPQQLVGSLVGSESLAAKILRGAVSVDRTYVVEISLAFLLHALEVLDAATPPVADRNRHTPSLVADYAAVSTLLISYAMEDRPTHHDTITTLIPFLDAFDTRIAVIVARAIVSQLKRECGAQRYTDSVRQIHSAAVESDDEAALANSVAHARAVLQLMH